MDLLEECATSTLFEKPGSRRLDTVHFIFVVFLIVLCMFYVLCVFSTFEFYTL